MRPVNLLPARYRPRKPGQDSKSAYVTLGVLALITFAVFGYVLTANKVTSRNAEIASVSERIASAETQAATLQRFGNFAGVKEARLSAVKSLATSRLDWERTFRELAHVLPGGVWLTGFNGRVGGPDGSSEETGPSLLLSGCARSHGQIADTMVRLRELHVAEDVELTQTAAGDDGAASSDEAGCGRFYSFAVSVLLAVPTAGFPAAPAEQAVPARLGGGG